MPVSFPVDEELEARGHDVVVEAVLLLRREIGARHLDDLAVVLDRHGLDLDRSSAMVWLVHEKSTKILRSGRPTSLPPTIAVRPGGDLDLADDSIVHLQDDGVADVLPITSPDLTFVSTTVCATAAPARGARPRARELRMTIRAGFTTLLFHISSGLAPGPTASRVTRENV